MLASTALAARPRAHRVMNCSQTFPSGDTHGLPPEKMDDDFRAWGALARAGKPAISGDLSYNCGPGRFGDDVDEKNRDPSRLVFGEQPGPRTERSGGAVRLAFRAASPARLRAMSESCMTIVSCQDCAFAFV